MVALKSGGRNIKTEKAQLQTDAYETAAARGYDLIKSEDPNLALLLALELLHPKKAAEIQSKRSLTRPSNFWV